MDTDDLADTLASLDVEIEDGRELIAARPRSPVVRAEIDRLAAEIAATIGRRGANVELPDPPVEADRFFYAYLCLALLPEIRAYHQAREIPDLISWATLTVFGRNLARHRRVYGVGGLDGSSWVVGVFRGSAYRLGRLVFERDQVGSAVASDTGASAADNALAVHIPAAGPLTPAACDDAFARAVGFFERFFPADEPSLAHCESWLLDPQLSDHLPADSNLVRFARRFSLTPANGRSQHDDETFVRWVFEAEDPANLALLTPRTTLERGILSHLEAGRHWRVRRGWLGLEPYRDVPALTP